MKKPADTKRLVEAIYATKPIITITVTVDAKVKAKPLDT